jgi:hypothetical protein
VRSAKGTGTRLKAWMSSSRVVSFEPSFTTMISKVEKRSASSERTLSAITGASL